MWHKGGVPKAKPLRIAMDFDKAIAFAMKSAPPSKHKAKKKKNR